MKKNVSILILFFTIVNLIALEVDQNEIETGNTGASIEFINYSGPYTVINTVAEIQKIGNDIGTVIKTTTTAGDSSRYYMIHAVDPAETEGFDADILILGANAGVDHIDNLRRIVAAYLTTAYGYSEKDASTLATFITIYNAVYRGKIDVFDTRYKKIVTSNLTANKVGLALRYDEWPGKTQIVIPLSDSRLSGTISTIDTTTLTDKNVVDKIKENSDSDIDTRKDMVELKTKESDAAQTRAENAQQDAAVARADVSAKKQELDTAQRESDQAQIAADQAQKNADAHPEDEKAQQQAAAAQQKADENSAIVESKKDEIATAQQTVKEKEATANADQTLADTKQKEVQTESKEIAADIQNAINAENNQKEKTATPTIPTPGYALRVVNESDMLSELLSVDISTGRVLKTSPLNSIRGRIILDTGSNLMAIAGKKGGNAAIKLVLIDPNTLEMLKQGVDTIAGKSVLIQNANDYYAVIEQNSDSYVIGRFDKNLEAKAKSSIEVLPVTPITITDKGLLVQDTSGNMHILRASDLTDQSQ